MKILHINDLYGTYWGGAARYIHRVSSILKEQGHDIYNFGTEGEGGFSTEKALVFSTGKSVNLWRLQHLTFNPGLFKSLRGYIHKVEPDIIHIHNVASYPATFLLAVLLRREAPVIQTVHDYSIICPRSWNVTLEGEACTGGWGIKCWRCFSLKFIPRFLLGILRSYLSHKIDAFTVASKDMKGKMEALGYKNIFLSPYFVDTSHDLPIPGREEKGRVLHIAELGERKGTRYIIEAMPIIVKEVPEAKLHIIGDGVERENLAKLKASLRGALGYNDKKIACRRGGEGIWKLRKQ